MKNRKIRIWVICGFLLSQMAAINAAADTGPGIPDEQGCEVPRHLRITRPDPEGPPTEVRVGFYLLDMTEIDDKKQTFKVDFVGRLEWKDPRLAVDSLGKSLEGCEMKLSDIWNPEVTIINRRELKQEWENTLKVDNRGNVVFEQRLSGELSSRLDLRDFPFDRQVVSIKIVARNSTPEDVALVADPEVWGGRFEKLSLPGWSVALGEGLITTEYIAPQDLHLARIDIPIIADRLPNFHIWRVFIPLSLIVFMAWTVFWIDPANMPPQFSIATASVLTMIAFQLSLGYLLPSVSYLTRVDRFLLGSSFLVFMALGEAVLTSRLAKRDRHVLALKIDTWARWIYAALFGVVIVATVWI